MAEEDDLDIYDDDVQWGMWYEMMADDSVATPVPPATGEDETDD